MSLDFLGKLLPLILLGILLSAGLRTFFQDSFVLVAWGDDGSLPAMGYVSCRTAFRRKDFVLCPGGTAATLQLVHGMERRGGQRLDTVFSLTNAAAVRGTGMLLKKMPAGELLFLSDVRNPKNALKLMDLAKYSGIHVRICDPEGAGVRGSNYDWDFTMEKSGDGEFHWHFYHQQDGVQIDFSQLQSGCLALEIKDAKGQHFSKEIPRSNRGGEIIFSLQTR